MSGRGHGSGRYLLAASALTLVACVVALVVYDMSGADRFELRRLALALFVVSVLAGALACAGWWRDRRATAAALEAQARLQAEAEAARADAAAARAQAEKAREEAADQIEQARAEAARQIQGARAEAREQAEAAQAAAQERIDAVQAEADQQIEAARSEAAQQVEVAQAEAQQRVAAAQSEAERKAEAVKSEAQEQIEAARAEAQEQVEAAQSEAQEQVEAAQSEATRDREEADRRLQSERRSREVVERARRAERQWAQELRSQVVSLHRERGALSNPDDIAGLVLQTAMSLLDADKGLLLRRDDESDRLSVARHLGFEHDPAESALARSFAERVLSQDETIRENDEAALDAASRTPADDEIDNIVAIPIYVRDEFGGAVVIANKEGGFDEFDDDVLLALGDHAGSVLDNARLRSELRSSYLATVQMLSDAIAAKDPFLGGHSREVSGFVSAVAERLGVDPRRREELVFGSLLHDIGKIGISERILLKPARLTPEERAIIELHPRIGYRLVSKIPALEPIAAGVLHHHERYDGGGYPARLRGEQIPIEARIISVADSFSAMTQDRPYRSRMSIEAACAELERCAGTQFDPEVVKAFVEEVRRGPAPWDEDDRGQLGEALGDSELAVHRGEGEPLLGSGTMAIIDNLTLLYSHRYLHEAAAAEAQRAEVQSRPFALILVELTGLAALNEREGHAAGDVAIQSAARALQRAASRCAGTACRYSGDRLALLIPGADQEAAEACLTGMLADWPGTVPVRHGLAIWQRGQRGADVVAAARTALAATAVRAAAVPPPAV